MDDLLFIEVESRAERQRRARVALFEALRAGRIIGLEEMAQARGLVVRERENSVFSDAWISLALLFMLVGLLAGRNAPLIALGAGLLVVVLVGRAWRAAALAGVTYERSFDRTHLFPDETVEMRLTISNRKLLPLTWLQFRDELPVAPEDASQLASLASKVSGRFLLQNTLSLGGYERSQRTIRLRFGRRGFYTIGPVRYQSGDPFTLFTVDRQHDHKDTLVVYPQVWPLEELALPPREIFGEVRVRRSLFADPLRIQGVREYQPQDRFRDVHWKATARAAELQTKLYEPASGMTAVIFLNVATYKRHWMGYDPELLERAVSVAASICSYAAEQRWGLGLCANGSVPGSDQPLRVPPGRSPEQLLRCLEALAAVTEFATGSVEILMQRESRRLPWAATLVLVTPIVTGEMAAALLRLHEAGRRVALISVAHERPPVINASIPSFHVPAQERPFRPLRAEGEALEEALRTPV
ncbi:MAG: DUF58 domain-containing protein [Candidatus Promineifilaceae bacterium]